MITVCLVVTSIVVGCVREIVECKEMRLVDVSP